MEWEQQQQDQQQKEQQQQAHQDPPPLQQIHELLLEGPSVNSGGINSNGGVGVGVGGGGRFVYHIPMMTDEQLQVLAQQIAAYSTICEQLENLQRHVAAAASASSHTDYSASGFMLRNNPYFTPLTMMACSRDPNPKINTRQRWSPTPEQLQILERLFDEQGNEAPSKDKVKELTAQLAKHGQIVENNVYNWFQNRKARFKKKQH